MEQEAFTQTVVASELYRALERLLNKYVGLVESGDCGFWGAEDETEVKDAREAIAFAKRAWQR